VSYWEIWYDAVKYAYEDAGGWHIQTVEGGLGLSAERFTSLAVDSAGLPHITYYAPNGHHLKYARMVGPQAGELAGVLVGGTLRLTWGTVTQASAYWVYGASNLPWFVPGMGPGYEHRVAIIMPPTTTWSSVAGVGDPNTNWTYLVTAVDATEQVLATSNRVGEQDFAGDIP
jgi:hypothetical protein